MKKSSIFLALGLLSVDFAIKFHILWLEVLKDIVLLTLLPLGYMHFVGIKKENVGLKFNSKESLKYSIGLIILASPIMVYASTFKSFQLYYPYWDISSIENFIFYEGIVLFAIIFNVEFFFRGFLLFSLEKEIGGKMAILLHSILYVFIHLGKPWPEIPYSFFAGLVFGYLALKTRSILPSTLTHWIGASIFDILVYYAYLLP
jgi:membrane protease YdiL (CAAX protease family)